ncbi:ribonuclease H-like domain-containing protein [Tanacetum coccineum]
MQFLMGLNDVYQQIRSNILAKNHIRDVKDAFNVVSREGSHRGLHLGSRFGSGLGSKVQPVAFVVKSNNFKGNDFKKGSNTANRCPNPNLLCKIWGNSNSRTFNGSAEAQRVDSISISSTTFNTSFTKEQMMKILSMINEKPSGSANANILNLTVRHRNETLAKITVVGNLRLIANVVLFDVLVVHEYCISLFFVHKFIRDGKLFVGFDEHKCYILKLVKTVGTGNKSGDLYFFDVEHYAKSKFGLSNSNVGLKYDKHSSPCDIRHKAKQTRDPFPLSDCKSESVGDLVHLNLWGPYRVVSKDGYKYVLTIVDDYNRVVWAYLIKTKDEVDFYIESFVELISTQFNKKIKVFRPPSSVLSGASPYLLVY